MLTANNIFDPSAAERDKQSKLAELRAEQDRQAEQQRTQEALQRLAQMHDSARAVVSALVQEKGRAGIAFGINPADGTSNFHSGD